MRPCKCYEKRKDQKRRKWRKQRKKKKAGNEPKFAFGERVTLKSNFVLSTTVFIICHMQHHSFFRYQWKPRSQKKFKLGVTEKDWVDYLNYLLNMATQTTDQQNALKDAMARAKQVHT